jgi:hypothetical protein
MKLIEKRVLQTIRLGGKPIQIYARLIVRLGIKLIQKKTPSKKLSAEPL